MSTQPADAIDPSLRLPPEAPSGWLAGCLRCVARAALRLPVIGRGCGVCACQLEKSRASISSSFVCWREGPPTSLSRLRTPQKQAQSLQSVRVPAWGLCSPSIASHTLPPWLLLNRLAPIDLVLINRIASNRINLLPSQRSIIEILLGACYDTHPSQHTQAPQQASSTHSFFVSS